MKKFTCFIVFFLCMKILIADENYLRAHFISVELAQNKWGIRKLDPDKFKNKIFYKDRASMAVYALKEQSYKGDKLIDVRKQLGDPDGYFFNDTILAYQIDRFKKDKKEAWQLVFIPDEKNNQLVGAIKIHKKCCYENNP